MGEDRFTYRYCDVVGADDRTDCDTATVTVTKKPPGGGRRPRHRHCPGRAHRHQGRGQRPQRRRARHPQVAGADRPAPKGEARPQSDGKIEYRPGPAFTGVDSFQYDYCGGPVVINAARDCRPATVTVDVGQPPQITSVTPNPTPPNREVVVTGTTGPCREGTLRLRIPQPGQDDVEVAVTAGQDGRFEAPLKVPGGTFVGTYTLELRVDCAGRERVAKATLEVRNQRPDAVDDRAQTAKGRSVTIDVTGNDTDPDGDDGYRTSVEATQPANGGTEVLSGDRVRYTPDDAFGGGEDPFTYTLCETVDANGGKDCDSATVTVTVIGGRTRCRSTTPTRPPCGTSRCRFWSPRTTSSRTRPSWRSGPPRRTARPSSRNSPGRPHPVHPLRLHRHGQLHLRLLPLGGRRDRQGGLPSSPR